jgi:recombination associated protein RdgC
LSSRGFVPPFGQHHDAFQQLCDGARWLTVGGEDKLLPGAVVNDLLQKKLAAIEEKEGRKPGGRTRKRLKDDLVTELLPRAFVRPVRSDALLDGTLGVIAVDTSSRKTGRESVVSRSPSRAGQLPGAAAERRSRAARHPHRLDRRRCRCPTA